METKDEQIVVESTTVQNNVVSGEQSGLDDNIIKDGDMIVIYLDPLNTSCINVKKGVRFQNKYGHYNHDDIIGKQYGSKIESKNGFIYVLRPTPSLITNSLPHRTQILYHIDIATIIQKLDIKPGDIVVESGTGSGSLSTSLSWAVNPGGHLYTFEFNQDRAQKADEQFKQAKMDNITVTWRDACGEGFEPKNEQEYGLKECDAVFLDLPKPWEAIGHANKVLKKGGRICIFSPCIEQIQRSYEELEKQGFIDLRTFETLLRSYEKRSRGLKSIEERQTGKKRRLNETFTKEEIKETEDLGKKSATTTVVTATTTVTATDAGVTEENKLVVETEKHSEVEKPTVNGNNTPAPPRVVPKFYYTSGLQFAQGHTGYLAFAVKYP